MSKSACAHQLAAVHYKKQLFPWILLKRCSPFTLTTVATKNCNSLLCSSIAESCPAARVLETVRIHLSMAPFWEDPRALAINRRRSHTPLRSFVSSEKAVRYLVQPPLQQQHPCPAESSEQLLSGCSWRFKLYRNPDEVLDNVYHPDFDDSSFESVSVLRLCEVLAV